MHLVLARRDALDVALVMAPVSTLACTVCITATGQAVRARVFGSDFWGNVAVALAPFLVLVLLIAFAQALYPRASRLPHTPEHPP